jgi:hypothetical protein
MRTGASLALIALGAILAFAITASTSWFNVNIAGYVLIVIGLAGLFLNRRLWPGRQLLVRRTRPVTTVEERVVPQQYVVRDPGTATRPGLPVVPSVVEPTAAPQPVPDTRVERVVEEDYYEE